MDAKIDACFAGRGIFSQTRLMILVGVLTGILIFLIVLVIYMGFNYLGYFKTPLPTTVPVVEKKSPLGKINILVLGINKRKNDSGRSNVTCVVTIDKTAKKIDALWIPRDSRVKIPGYDWDKIGHAYHFGGVELAKQTVESLLGIRLTYYIAVDMDGFCKIVDTVGGVNIDVEKCLYYYDPYDAGEAATNHGLIDLKAGMQHMDGNTALQYVRFRHDENGDIGRIERQRKFLRAFLSQLTSPVAIAKIPTVIYEASNSFQTDLPLGKAMWLGMAANDIDKFSLNTTVIDGEATFIDGISYWLPDIIAVRDQTAIIQGKKFDKKHLNTSQKLAEEYVKSLPDVIETDYGLMSPRQLFKLDGEAL